MKKILSSKKNQSIARTQSKQPIKKKKKRKKKNEITDEARRKLLNVMKKGADSLAIERQHLANMAKLRSTKQ